MSYRLPMKCRVIFAARMVGLGLGVLAAMAAVIVGTSHSVAQQGAPKAQPKAKPKATPTPQAQQGGQPDLTYSFWTKVCQKGPEADAKQVCFLARNARVESGMPSVRGGAGRAGRRSEQVPARHVTAWRIAPGRHSCDHRQWPAAHRFLRDLPLRGLHGRVRGQRRDDYQDEERSDFARAGINGSGQPINIPMPLADFAKAHDGPPIDPKELEQQDKK